MMLERLRKAFGCAVKHNISVYEIYYSGHGNKTAGDWVVYLDKPGFNTADELITIPDIL